MTSREDYYELLRVGRTADNTEIKKSYRKLAFEYHPDRNPGDAKAESQFKKVSEAYEVLSDPQKRQIYDQFGHAGLEGRAGFHGFQNTEDIFSAFGDIFEDFFGFSTGSRSHKRPRKGRDVQIEVEVDFLEACFGIEKEVALQLQSTCETCAGSGAKPGSESIKCNYCHGRGQVQMSQGFFTISTTCPKCNGEGAEVAESCPVCSGSGTTQKKKKIHVKIPAGIQQGMRLVMNGQGEAGQNDGTPGDVYILVRVREHEEFKRDGDHIHSKIIVPFPYFVLGAELTINTIDGEEKIAIQAGTQSGDVLCLKGKGVKSVRGSRRGDHYVLLQATTPQKLSKTQKELMEKLAEEFPLERATQTAKKKNKKSFFGM